MTYTRIYSGSCNRCEGFAIVEAVWTFEAEEMSCIATCINCGKTVLGTLPSDLPAVYTMKGEKKFPN